MFERAIGTTWYTHSCMRPPEYCFLSLMKIYFVTKMPKENTTKKALVQPVRFTEIITARVRTYDGRLCFHRCVSVQLSGGGYPIPSLSRGIPHPRSGGGGYSISGRGGTPSQVGGGTPSQVWGGTPSQVQGGTPSQVGGYPISGLGGYPIPGLGGYPIPGPGVPHLRSGGVPHLRSRGGTPSQVQGGYPGTPPE